MKRIRLAPSKRLLKCFSVLCIVGLALPIVIHFNGLTQLSGLPMGLALIAIALAGYDLIISRHPPQVAVKREVPSNLSVHVEQKVSIAMANRGYYTLSLQCSEIIPEHWHCSNNFHGCRLEPGQIAEFDYQVTPSRRGPSQISATEIKVESKFGFWDYVYWIEHVSEHKVFPNFTAISDLAGLQGSVNLTQAGLKKFNKRGSGMDFLQLRDYREGESIKQIDWRATSRFNKLISREYQEEKNQHVIIMLDSGRRMRVQDDDLSYFDHALNSLIMLSYTALKNGDNLSLQSFGSESRWLSHVRGAQNVSKVMQHFYDLYPQKIASDYLSAAQELLVKQPKRALILLVTCLRDEDFEDLLKAVQLLKAKHLVAVISIEEPIYKRIDDEPVETFEQAIMYASAHKIKKSIDRNVQRLKQKGVICINAPASHLTPNVLNTYLSIKKAGLL
ncbi:DUF58 domain-containing protein [Aliiglaciecola sp. 2_MG-2023]|uniref:DUF58 domain-containing protein n=1 Tax=unclassified Aliiglaciecola TaxID=2593648 RepID=UPI0026E2FF08|nr:MULTISPECIES: DUF58 domain-containing protein [unclassified Aliiglaciecola]MDO6713137.1 DUF58 domain-containing protein [Aliiglaciecola sp. 2_MG-2023]MDO6754189.1 DUF58 domain-containing protein [Aliiglaciecola sp. 1_MG-2023]